MTTGYHSLKYGIKITEIQIYVRVFLMLKCQYFAHICPLGPFNGMAPCAQNSKMYFNLFELQKID